MKSAEANDVAVTVVEPNQDNELPTYNQAIDQRNEEPPPSYESVFGRVQAAREEAGGNHASFLFKLCGILMGTIGFTILICIIFAVPVTMVTIGSLKLHECPAQKYIPIYLVVGGGFGILKTLLSLIQQLKNKCTDSNPDENTKKNPLEGILDTFLVAWFIAGNVWVYRAYEPDYNNPEADDYCNKTLYLFSFWLITSTYILVGLSCLCFCCIGCLALYCSKSSS